MTKLRVITKDRGRGIVEAQLQLRSRAGRIKEENSAQGPLALQILNYVFSIGAITLVTAVIDINFRRFNQNGLVRAALGTQQGLLARCGDH